MQVSSVFEFKIHLNNEKVDTFEISFKIQDSNNFINP